MGEVPLYVGVFGPVSRRRRMIGAAQGFTYSVSVKLFGEALPIFGVLVLVYKAFTERKTSWTCLVSIRNKRMFLAHRPALGSRAPAPLRRTQDMVVQGSFANQDTHRPRGCGIATPRSTGPAQ